MGGRGIIKNKKIQIKDWDGKETRSRTKRGHGNADAPRSDKAAD
jgi:hypothetical protein